MHINEYTDPFYFNRKVQEPFTRLLLNYLEVTAVTTIQDTIIQTIMEKSFIPNSVSAKSDLYNDLGFDSLSFAALLIDIEEIFTITISISEMQDCINVGRLIAIVTTKLERNENIND